MTLDLDELSRVARSLGFECEEAGAGGLDVALPDALILRFRNLEDGDALVSFADTPWHFHPPLTLERPNARVRSLDAETVLRAVARGELVAVELHEQGQLTDHWLVDGDGCVSVKHTQPGEEIRLRVAGARGNGADGNTETTGRALSELQAFRAARLFLESFNEREGSEAIALLVTWTAEHGDAPVSADPAQWHDWMEAVDRVLAENAD